MMYSNKALNMNTGTIYNIEFNMRLIII